MKNRRKKVTSSQRLNTAGVDRTAFATILCPKMSGASFGQSVLETSPLDILVNVRLDEPFVRECLTHVEESIRDNAFGPAPLVEGLQQHKLLIEVDVARHAPANHQTEPTRALFLSVVWSISVLQIRLIYLLPQSPAPTSRKGAAAEGSTRAARVTKYIEFQVGVKWQHVYLPARSLHTTVKRRCGRLHAASRCGSRGGSYESWCKF